MEQAQRQILPSIPIRFRNNPYPGRAMKFEIGGQSHEATGSDSAGNFSLQVLKVTEDGVDAVVEGIRRSFLVRQHGDDYYVRSHQIQRKVTRLPRYPRHIRAGSHESANSPMPGQVLRIMVSEGQKVQPGEPLVALEAMKMEQTIKATMNGVVKSILVKPGEMVAPGQMLVEIQSLEDVHDDAHASSSTSNS
jgi:biotin carboxyl carrier protein